MVNDIESALCLDVTSLRTLAESNAVHHGAALRVDEFKLDVLLVSPDNFARSEVINLPRAEERLMVVRAIRGKTSRSVP